VERPPPKTKGRGWSGWYKLRKRIKRPKVTRREKKSDERLFLGLRKGIRRGLAAQNEKGFGVRKGFSGVKMRVNPGIGCVTVRPRGGGVAEEKSEREAGRRLAKL